MLAEARRGKDRSQGYNWGVKGITIRRTRLNKTEDRRQETPKDLRAAQPEGKSAEQPLPPACQVPVTNDWLVQQDILQIAYASKRAEWRDQFFHGRKPEPQTETERRSRRGTIFDGRQFKLEL